MKNYYSTALHTSDFFRSISLFILILLVTVLSSNVNAQMNYRAEGDSHIMITTDSNRNVISTAVSSLVAEADFIIKDGVLDEVSSLKLRMPAQKVNESSDLDFKLTHVMVLPIMRKIHVVGMLNINGISKRTDIDFNFVVNQDQSITLTGDKAINLSDFHTNSTVEFASLTKKSEKQLKLEMNFVFKNEPYKLTALNNASQDNTRIIARNNARD